MGPILKVKKYSMFEVNLTLFWHIGLTNAHADKGVITTAPRFDFLKKVEPKLR